MKNTKAIVISILIVAVLVGAILLARSYDKKQATAPSIYDGFAQCLKDAGAEFYGAFWCPHCQNQKKLFGTAQKHLPYIECSTPNGQGRLPVCADKKIESYPTWIFKDGSRQGGEMSLSALAVKTSCVLPDSNTSATSTAQ